MTEPARLAVAGVGNNISALLQGVYYYGALCTGRAAEPPGIRRPVIGGMGPQDIKFVAAFDVSAAKCGIDLRESALTAPNNYPRLDVEVPVQNVVVEPGIVPEDIDLHIDRVAENLKQSNAEVLLYSLPTGLQWAATAYALAAVKAGAAFVNCTPEMVARDEDMLSRFADAGVPVLGDDLASHMGSSVLHRTLLALFAQRGITLESSYQLNLGGNEDFKNLRDNGGSKRASKMNAVAQDGVPLDRVEVIPSAGYVSHLGDRKVAFINVRGLGWGGTPVELDLRLGVQDSSNAAGVIVDLVRIAAAGVRCGKRGFVDAAEPLLKSPPRGHGQYDQAAAEASLESLDLASFGGEQ